MGALAYPNKLVEVPIGPSTSHSTFVLSYHYSTTVFIPYIGPHLYRSYSYKPLQETHEKKQDTII